jgi:hypothetical protein
MRTIDDLTAARLRELLNYEPATGIFRWRVRRTRKALAGTQAGYVQVSLRSKDTGYRRIRVDGRKYRAGRLAWLWMMGRWPRHNVGHENTVNGD